MTRKNSNRRTAEIKAMMANDGEFLRPIVRTVIQEFLEAEMSETDPECPGTLNQFQLATVLYTRRLATAAARSLDIL